MCYGPWRPVMKSVLLLCLTLMSLSSFALSNKEIAELYNSGKVQERALKYVQINNYAQLMAKMVETAEAVAVIWGDSILEGPFEQLEKEYLDQESIMGLFYQNELIGFSAEVKAKAMFTDQNFEGAIIHKFLVNENGEWVMDFYAPEEFEP